jgi:hypothetical protein
MRSVVDAGGLRAHFCLLGLLMIEREGASAAEMWLSLTMLRNAPRHANRTGWKRKPTTRISA